MRTVLTPYRYSVTGYFKKKYSGKKFLCTVTATAGCFQPRSLNDYLTNQPTNQPTVGARVGYCYNTVSYTE
jgi:hypothetical protein